MRPPPCWPLFCLDIRASKLGRPLAKPSCGHLRRRIAAPHRHPFCALPPGLPAVKLDRMFAKPFLASFTHDDGVTCLARNPRRLNSLLSGAHKPGAAGGKPGGGAGQQAPAESVPPACARKRRHATRAPLHPACSTLGRTLSTPPARPRARPPPPPPPPTHPPTHPPLPTHPHHHHHHHRQALLTAISGYGTCQRSAACDGWLATQGPSKASA